MTFSQHAMYNLVDVLVMLSRERLWAIKWLSLYDKRDVETSVSNQTQTSQIHEIWDFQQG